jgi:hypothetical protein
MDMPKYTIRHDIGLVTTTGLYTQICSGSAVPFLAEGTTVATCVQTSDKSCEADIWVSPGATKTVTLATSSDPEDETVSIVHNPMMAFWKRAKLFYGNRVDAAQKGYPLLFDDCALIISDLGQSLSMLYGRHWNSIKEPYKRMVGTPPTLTPDILWLIEDGFPLAGWKMASEDPILSRNLQRFMDVYYKDLIKHFEYDKFLTGLQITIADLSTFMEIARESWIWLVQKVFKKPYSPTDTDFCEFHSIYAQLV